MSFRIRWLRSREGPPPETGGPAENPLTAGPLFSELAVTASIHVTPIHQLS